MSENELDEFETDEIRPESPIETLATSHVDQSVQKSKPEI